MTGRSSSPGQAISPLCPAATMRGSLATNLSLSSTGSAQVNTQSLPYSHGEEERRIRNWNSPHFLEYVLQRHLHDPLLTRGEAQRSSSTSRYAPAEGRAGQTYL